MKSVTPNLVASLVFFGIAFSFKIFISSSETSTNREAAILEISAPAIITSREVIIATYDAILDQSDHEDLYDHLSNYTKMIYMQEREIKITSVNRQKIGRSRPEDFSIKFNPPVHLDSNMKHELAVNRVSMTYSWHNINNKNNNNKIKYSKDSGVNWETITFVAGMYSYDDLNEYTRKYVTRKTSRSWGWVESPLYWYCTGSNEEIKRFLNIATILMSMVFS